MDPGQAEYTFGKKFQRMVVVFDTLSSVLNSDIVAKALTRVRKLYEAGAESTPLPRSRVRFAVNQ